MRISQPAIFFTLPFFLSSLRSLVQTIITNNNPDNHNDLLIIIHEMCNAHKMVLPGLYHSKKTIPHNIYIVNTSSGGIGLNNYILNTNTKKLYEN